jgi:hypothetical protein
MIYNSRKKLLAVCALISQNKEPAVLRCVKSLGAEERKICSSIKLPIWVLRVRVDGRRTLWLVQRIRAFVFLPHPVDDEHYHKDGTQQTNHCTSNNSWNNWKGVLLIVHTGNQNNTNFTCKDARLGEKWGRSVLWLVHGDVLAGARVYFWRVHFILLCILWLVNVRWGVDIGVRRTLFYWFLQGNKIRVKIWYKTKWTGEELDGQWVQDKRRVSGEQCERKDKSYHHQHPGKKSS